MNKKDHAMKTSIFFLVQERIDNKATVYILNAEIKENSSFFAGRTVVQLLPLLGT